MPNENYLYYVLNERFNKSRRVVEIDYNIIQIGIIYIIRIIQTQYLVLRF